MNKIKDFDGYKDRNTQMGVDHEIKALRVVAPHTRVKILAKLVEFDENKIQLSKDKPIESYLEGFDAGEVEMFMAAYQQILEQRLMQWRQEGLLDL